jgi:hypothetical protein
MVTLISHDGTCCIGINADGTAIPDTEHFVACLRAGFDEVLALVDRRLADAGADAQVRRTSGVGGR